MLLNDIKENKLIIKLGQYSFKINFQTFAIYPLINKVSLFMKYYSENLNLNISYNNTAM